MSSSTDTLAVGILGRPHGLRGELFLRLYNPESLLADTLDVPLEITLERAGRFDEFRVVHLRGAGEDLLVTIEGISSREAAAALTNGIVHIPRPALPTLEEGEFYVQDLVGCRASDQAGRPLGVVRSTFWNGAHDVLSVIDDAGRELLVPAVPEFLVDVQLAERQIVLDPHEGEDSNEGSDE